MVFRYFQCRLGYSTLKRISKCSTSTKSFEGDDNGGGEEEDYPLEALFNLLEEDFKNDNSSIDDEEISEEDLDALADELARALGGGDDVDGIDLFGSATGDVVDDNEDEDEDDDDIEEDERQTKLKNWQLRRLAYAWKVGRHKTSIKNLAAEILCSLFFEDKRAEEGVPEKRAPY
ncbi:Protein OVEREXPRESSOR OF CATIONIC PEROXIDASE 3 [Cardamine amara subsp. amara]